MWVRKGHQSIDRHSGELKMVSILGKLSRKEGQKCKTASTVSLTKVIICQHLLNFLGDGVRIELGGHRNHFLDAETRMTRYRQWGGQLRLPTRGILGQRFDTGRL